MSVQHYENFPVASWLCPPRLRPAVTAIYHFARTADDLADEGSASTAERLADLEAYRADLDRVATGQPAGPRWHGQFQQLAQQMRRHALPLHLLHDLLDAFEQDVQNPLYPTRERLMDYCRRSANPIGRLLLHLQGIADAPSLQRADAICSALQLINFWQDLSVDGPRRRHYVPESDRRAHGVTPEELRHCIDSPRSRAMVATLCDWAHSLMLQGAPLATRMPGRAGWELRLVVQGGLHILEKIRAMEYAALLHRPTIKATDTPRLLWRALCMSSSAAAPSRAA
ncbi:MAG: squalene synthase HpnC [Rubrivivax sp.]|nr:squalene synthase HpnC [Rubrivivax sp.]